MTSRRFDSIWDAIEDTPYETNNLKVRSALMRDLEAHIRDQGWTQAQAAKHFGVTQPRISDLMRGKINLFSIDMLVRMATAAGLQVEMHVAKAA